MGMGKGQGVLARGARLLLPWPALIFGTVLLTLAQAWTMSAAAQDVWQMLQADVFLLLRAVVLGSLMTGWPIAAAGTPTLSWSSTAATRAPRYFACCIGRR